MEGLEAACKGHAVTWPLEAPKNMQEQSVNLCDFWEAMEAVQE